MTKTKKNKNRDIYAEIELLRDAFDKTDDLQGILTELCENHENYYELYKDNVEDAIDLMEQIDRRIRIIERERGAMTPKK